jgi:hypothetical protein
VNQNAVAFADNGTGIAYNNAVWIFNDALIYNKADITRAGGTTQNATNASSVEKYFLHSYNQQNLLMQTDAIALDYARAYVASRAETTVRCDSIVLDLYTENYTTGVIAAHAIGMSIGGSAVFGIMAASASYIAAPAAVRIALPNADSGLSLGLALGVTFPFNLTIGIPLAFILSRSIG